MLIYQYSNVGEDESADPEAEKLRCVAHAELQPNVSRARMFESRVFDLTGYLIWKPLVAGTDIQTQSSLPSD